LVTFLRIPTRMESGARSASNWNLRRIRPDGTSEQNVDTTFHGNNRDTRITKLRCAEVVVMPSHLVCHCIQSLHFRNQLWDAVERIWHEVRAFRISSGKIAWLVADIGDDRESLSGNLRALRSFVIRGRRG
jgi:hypothetical protein